MQLEENKLRSFYSFFFPPLKEVKTLKPLRDFKFTLNSFGLRDRGDHE